MANTKQLVLANVAFVVTEAAGYTAAVGDLVEMSDDYEVRAATAAGVHVGHVTSIEAAADNKAKQLTVNARGSRIFDALVATGNLSAGMMVVVAGIDTVRPYVAGTDDAQLIAGLCIKGANIGARADILEL